MEEKDVLQSDNTKVNDSKQIIQYKGKEVFNNFNWIEFWKERSQSFVCLFESCLNQTVDKYMNPSGFCMPKYDLDSEKVTQKGFKMEEFD